MKFSTDGLVLKVTEAGESDRILTVLTRDYGTIRAFANGARRLKSDRQSATQSLCYSQFSFYKSKDSYVIDDARSIETFFRLRDDIEKLSLAQYFCELAGELAPEMENTEDYLRLTLNCLHMLSTDRRSQKFLKAVIELRMMTLSGYMPSLAACAHCGREPDGTVRFSTDGGSIFCPECSQTGITVSAGVLNAMRHICSCSDERLFSFELAESSLETLSKASEKYLLSQCRRNFRALDFYNRLFR